ncbi:MAG TPA: hypothetical protein VNW51_03340 [Mucilaginibacter sp.]|jgi:hypothetical protein|nr:hypothetical protein [Mucilaginibacter sp.]
MERAYQRDHIGNMILPDNEIDWNSPELKYWERTYVFQYFDSAMERFLPCFDILRYDLNTVDTARNHPDFLEVKLHHFPLEMIYRDRMIHHRNFEQAVLNTFFAGVFEPRHPSISTTIDTRYSRLLMKRSHYEQIMNYINDASLLPFRDLLLEVIANGQELFLEYVFYASERSLKKKINTIDRNIKDLTEIFKRSTREEDEVFNSEHELKYPDFIQFAFNDKQFKISDHFLIADFIRSYKDKLNNSEVKNWRFMLERFQSIYNDDVQELKFRERYVGALLEMFKYLQKIPQTGKTSNESLRLIDQFLLFSGIYAGGIDEQVDMRIKHLRNWLKRNAFDPREKPPPLVFNREILEKYFDKDFLDLPMDETIDEESGSIAGFIMIRFGLEKRKFELVYIVKCLSQVIWLIMDQASSGLLNKSASSTKFEDYKSLIEKISAGESLSSVNLSFGDTSISLNDTLPLKIVTDALKYYHDNFKEEVENDIVQSHIVKEVNNGQISYNPNQRPDFQKPEEQFVVGFVGQMYQFLLNEFPPDDHDFSPKVRYYYIIAQLLIKTHYFRKPGKNEDVAMQQVANWHSMYLKR